MTDAQKAGLIALAVFGLLLGSLALLARSDAARLTQQDWRQSCVGDRSVVSYTVYVSTPQDLTGLSEECRVGRVGVVVGARIPSAIRVDCVCPR